MSSEIVLAMTGASGALYSVRLLEVLLQAGRSVHLTISPAATQVFRQELGLALDLTHFDPRQFIRVERVSGRPSVFEGLGASESGNGKIFVPNEPASGVGMLTYHHFTDYSAGIASGSFLTSGMVICPCSMGTLAALASGLSTNLIHRAADVHLKERRKLIVVPRETPLGSIQLDNMKRLSDAGAVILPAMPGFYHNPQSIDDLIDFVVGRICDQLGFQQNLMRRWGSTVDE